MSRAVIVVPCYNESQRLDVRRFQDFVRRDDSADFLFVNDGSRDCTLELLEQLHDSNPQRFSFLHLARNQGKAEAVRAGLLLALQSPVDCVGFWDADLATPLEAIPTFCQVLLDRPEIEMVLGTRLRLLGRAIERQPLRHYLGRLFATAASWTLGVGIYDTQCGAKLFRVTADLHTVLARPFRSRWIFDVELLARLKLLRRGSSRRQLEQAIYEQPLEQWRDVAGSKVKASDFPKAFFELAGIYWNYLRPGLTAPSSPIPSMPAAAASEIVPSSGEVAGDKPEKRAA